jgi:hypothetical protein
MPCSNDVEHYVFLCAAGKHCAFARPLPATALCGIQSYLLSGRVILSEHRGGLLGRHRAHADLSGELLLRNPITGIPGCCARVASGHATAAPLSSVMKSHFSDGYLEIGSVLASVFGSVGRTIQER